MWAQEVQGSQTELQDVELSAHLQHLELSQQTVVAPVVIQFRQPPVEVVVEQETARMHQAMQHPAVSTARRFQMR